MKKVTSPIWLTKSITERMGGKSALELCGLASTMLEAEGHELVGVHVHSVDVLGSITS